MVLSSQQVIKKALASSSLENWKNSPLHNSSEANTMLWLPVFQIDSGKTLGLTKNGYWASDSRDSVIVYEPGSSVLPLFPCLEIEYSKFRGLGKAAFSRLGLSERLIDTFPTSELVYLALTDVSGYWAELALNWLEDIEIDNRIKEQLQQITKAKWASQKTRQKASKFLRGKIKQKT